MWNTGQHANCLNMWKKWKPFGSHEPIPSQAFHLLCTTAEVGHSVICVQSPLASSVPLPNNTILQQLCMCKALRQSGSLLGKAPTPRIPCGQLIQTLYWFWQLSLCRSCLEKLQVEGLQQTSSLRASSKSCPACPVFSFFLCISCTKQGFAGKRDTSITAHATWSTSQQALGFALSRSWHKSKLSQNENT